MLPKTEKKEEAIHKNGKYIFHNWCADLANQCTPCKNLYRTRPTYWTHSCSKGEKKKKPSARVYRLQATPDIWRERQESNSFVRYNMAMYIYIYIYRFLVLSWLRSARHWAKQQSMLRRLFPRSVDYRARLVAASAALGFGAWTLNFHNHQLALVSSVARHPCAIFLNLVLLFLFFFSLSSVFVFSFLRDYYFLVRLILIIKPKCLYNWPVALGNLFLLKIYFKDKFK